MDDGLLSAAGIFVFEHALAEMLLARGWSPDLFLTNSLGLFAAASVAGCLDRAEALAAVCTQARLFERYCGEGTMIAVLAPSERFDGDPVLAEGTELAGATFASNHVLSLPAAHIDRVEERLAHLGLPFQRLPMRRAFHSRWIDQARAPFLDYLQGLGYRQSRVPLLCCSREAASLVITAGDFWEAVRKPIMVQRAVMLLERTGPWHYIDIGPSGSMATAVKYGLPGASSSRFTAVMTPFQGDLERLHGLLSEPVNAPL